LTQSASVNFSSRFLAQVFCDPSLYTAAVSTLANPGQNDQDEPKAAKSLVGQRQDAPVL